MSGEARPLISPGLQRYLPVWLPLASGGEGGVPGGGEAAISERGNNNNMCIYILV